MAAGLVGLNILDELNRGTPLEQLPENSLDLKRFADKLADNPLTRPLTETAQIFASAGEAFTGLIEIVLFLITPNPANVKDFNAFKQSIRMLVSIPAVQLIIAAVVIGGPLGTVAAAFIKNPELLEKLLGQVRAYFDER